MHKIFRLVVVLLLCSPWLGAQNQSFAGYVEAGDTATVKQNFYAAYRLYALAAEDGWSEDPDYEERLSEVYYKAGLAAYRATAYVPAEQYFLRLLARPDTATYGLTKYYLAQSVFRQGRYDQAVAHYDEFLAEQPGADPKLIRKANQQIAEADWAIDAMSRDEDVDLRHLPTGINTEDSDVQYIFGRKGKRYFSSNNTLWKADKVSPKRSLYRIMERTGETTARALSKSINLPDKNVAHAAFNAAGDRVYYSVCDFRDYDDMRCDLYSASVAADGSWSAPRKLEINAAGASSGQPAVGKVDSDGKEYLFFASDRPGGKGGMDLYRVALGTNGPSGEVTALTELNTAEDDVSPFWYERWQTLYFATNGRFSFGGLDVYKSFFVGGEFKDPINLGRPVNSSADDAYYTRFDENDQAYVASRRATSEAIYYSEEKDVCCYDLYEFAPDPRITLRVLTFNELSREELRGVTVALYQVTEDGVELLEEVDNPRSHEFTFQLTPGLRYELRATKEGYTTAKDAFDLSDPELAEVPYVERSLFLAPAVRLDVFTFNNVDQSDLPGTTVRLYEVMDNGERNKLEEFTNDDSNDSHFDLQIGKRYEVTGLKPGFGEAFAEADLSSYDADNYEPTLRRDLFLGQTLDVLVVDAKTEDPLNGATVTLQPGYPEPRTNPNGNDFNYVVNLNQDFTLTVSRDGYFPRTVPLRFDQEDVARFDGRLQVTVKLVSDDINDYLDLRVYFDNDHPDPDAYRTTTTLDYDQNYTAYLARRAEFVELAGKGLSEDDAFIARQDVDDFFTDEVVPGYEDLLKLADALEVHLANGRSYELSMVGYASPRASTSYNLRLSARRNVALENFFARFRSGVLAPFLENGQLSFRTERKGEFKNLGRIYEVLEAERESIYSVEASLERRVEFPKIFTIKSRK